MNAASMRFRVFSCLIVFARHSRETLATRSSRSEKKLERTINALCCGSTRETMALPAIVTPVERDAAIGSLSKLSGNRLSPAESVRHEEVRMTMIIRRCRRMAELATDAWFAEKDFASKCQ